METRITKMKILDTLRGQADKFVSQMQVYVLPTIDGCDLDRLQYYYSLLPHAAEGDDITPDTHIKLIKKIKSTVQGEIVTCMFYRPYDLDRLQYYYSLLPHAA